MSLANQSLKINIGPGIRDPYLELLTDYGQIQQKMKADVAKLPDAFQREVYERVSLVYGKARDAGLGQRHLVRNLTVLNRVLIAVTNDVSNAYAALSLFKTSAPVNRRDVEGAFARFSPEAKTKVQETLQRTRNIGKAFAFAFAGFDPTTDQVQKDALVKVGPAIATPYLELLTSYGEIQATMKAKVEQLPPAFQQEVYARLSVHGGYSEERDPQVGKKYLTRNLTALNDVLIEVTKDVSIANHVSQGLPLNEAIQLFSPTAMAQIEATLAHQNLFKDGVAFVFKDFDPKEDPREMLATQVVAVPVRIAEENKSDKPTKFDKGRVVLPPPSRVSAVSALLPPAPVQVDDSQTLRSLCSALEERRTEDANRLFSQLSRGTQSAAYRVLCYYYGTPTNDIERDGATNWQEDPTGLVRPVTIDGRRPIDLLDIAMKPAEGMQIVTGNINQYDVENGHDACAVISTLAILEFPRGKLETQEDINRVIQEGAGSYEACVQKAKALDGTVRMLIADGNYIPSTSALVMAGFGTADDLRQRNFIESTSIETWLGPLKRNAPHIALLTIGTSTMALMYDSKKAQWIYFNSHGDDHKSLDLVTEHTTAVRAVMTEKALIAFLRRKIDAVDPNQVGYIHAME